MKPEPLTIVDIDWKVVGSDDVLGWY